MDFRSSTPGTVSSLKTRFGELLHRQPRPSPAAPRGASRLFLGACGAVCGAVSYDYDITTDADNMRLLKSYNVSLREKLMCHGVRGAMYVHHKASCTVQTSQPVSCIEDDCLELRVE